jgi:hypothetical protein
MRNLGFLVLVAAMLAFGHGDAVGGDVYVEGWEGGTTAGWEPRSSASTLTVGSSGGNPNGYLGIGGDSNNSAWIGAVTTIAEATGDYWSAGVGVATLDLRFVSGSYVHACVRFSSAGGESDGWKYCLPGPHETGDAWRQAIMEIDSLWTDTDARFAGWTQGPNAPGFHETMSNVHSVEVRFLAVGSVDVRIDNFRLGPPPECLDDLPDPVLVFKGKRIAGDFLIKWEFAIENWSDYPPELFVPSPLQPPCGSNRAAPRTKIRFFLSSGNPITSNCEVRVTDPPQLQDIGFTQDLTGAPRIYVELEDRRCDLVYRSNTVSTVFRNDPPVANAGEDVTVDCAGGLTAVTVDASLTSDPEGGEITYEWFARGITFDDPTAVSTVGYFPKGAHTAGLRVSDGFNAAYDQVNITVNDHTPPKLKVRLNRRYLWPWWWRTRYVRIRACVAAEDACEGQSAFFLSGVHSNEPDPDNQPEFVRYAELGTADTEFKLLAKKNSDGSRRVYTVSYMSLDGELNIAADTSYVYVGFDCWGSALSGWGFDPSGHGFMPDAEHFALVVPSAAGRDAEPGFDATTIDIEEAQVANSSGALPPASVYWGDVTGDGLADCVIFYSVAETEKLLRDAQDEKDVVGFFYQDDSGAVYAVESVFELGKPVPLAMDRLRPAQGYSELALKEGSSGELRRAERAVASASLDRVYPNPFNPSIHLTYSLPADGRVRLHVFDVNGRLVRRLVSGEKQAGTHTAFWNAIDEKGAHVPSGVYFVKFQFGNASQTRKIVLLK